MPDELPAQRDEQPREGSRALRHEPPCVEHGKPGERCCEDDGQQPKSVNRDPEPVTDPGDRVPARRRRFRARNMPQQARKRRFADDISRRDLVLPERVVQRAG